MEDELDIGECILAAIGIRPLLAGVRGRILADEWTQIRRCAARVDAFARDLVNGSCQDEEPESLAYDKMLDQLTGEMDVSGLLSTMPMGSESGMLIGTIGRARTYLHDHFPIAVAQSVTSNVNLRPSDYAVGLFEDLLEIVDKPFSVFGMIHAGRLTIAQATALQTVYPKLYAYIVAALVLRIAREQATKKDYVPPFEHGLAVLLAIPGVDPAVMQMLQAPGAQQTSPPPEPQQQSDKKPTPTDRATRTQDLELSKQTP